MAVKARPKKVIDNKRIILLVDDKGEKITNPHALQDMSNDEIVTALHSFGTEKIILAYREAKTDPPVDLLKSYFEHYPKNITPDESILLQKAYGRDFMEAQYIKLLGSAETMKKLNGWQNFWGGVGRKVGYYKKLKHNDNRLAMSTLQDIENIVSKSEGKAGDVKEEKRIEILLNSKFQTVNKSLDAMGKIIDRQKQDLRNMAEDKGENKNPNSSSRLGEAGEQGIVAKNMAEVVSAVVGEQEEGVEDILKGYHTFIHLHNYHAQKFEEMIQISSPEIDLFADNFKLFSLKDTNFTINYDSKAKSDTIFMSKGTGMSQLGALALSIEQMCYTDTDMAFTAKTVTATLQAASFVGTGTIGEVTVDSTGLDFKELDVPLEEVTAFDGGFTVTNPKFHMVKDEKGKWIKDISIGGLQIVKEGAFSLILEKGAQKEGEEAANDNENAWRLQEKSNTSEVAATANSWEPKINNATADLKIGQAFHALLKEITFNKEQMSAGNKTISMNLCFGGKSIKTEASADEVGYYYKKQEPYFENVNGSVNLTLGVNVIEAELKGMNYSSGNITVETLTGSANILGHEATLKGDGISYSKEGVLDFQSISGDLKGGLRLLDIISLQNLSIAVEKQEKLKEQTEGGAGASSGADYNIVVEAAGGQSDLSGFGMKISRTRLLVTNKGELGYGEIEGTNININDGFIEASAAKMMYSKEAETLEAKDTTLKLLWNKEQQDISVKTMTYKKDNGVSVEGISGNIQLGSVGGNDVAAEITDASYSKEDGLTINTVKVNMQLMGEKILLEGTDLQIDANKQFTFTSLSAQLETWDKIPGFTLQGTKLEVKKDKGKGFEVAVSTTGVKLNASGVDLSAGQTLFEVKGGKLVHASIKGADLSFCGNVFTATADSVEYSNEESILVDVSGFTWTAKPSKDIDAKLSIGRGIYNGKTFTLQGIEGSLTCSMFGSPLSATVKDAAYEGDELVIGTASLDTNILGQNLKLSGTDITYSKAKGIDFATLELTTGSCIRIGSLLSITGGSVSIDKKNKDKWLTIAGSASASLQNIATLTVTDAVFTMSSTSEVSSELKSTKLNIGNDMIVMDTSAITYSSAQNEFSAAGLHGSASFGKYIDLTVGAAALAYQNGELSLSGISMNTNIALGSTSFNINFSDGTYEKQALSIPELTSSLRVFNKDILLNGKGLEFSKQGFSFVEIKGEILGEFNLFPNSGISITGPSVTINKQEENYQTILEAKQVLLEMGGIKLSAADMNFLIENGGLGEANVGSAALDINKGMITGSVANLHYKKGESGYSFSAGNMKGELNTGESLKGNAQIDDIKYENNKFTLANMNASFSAKLGGMDMNASFTGASYDEKEGLKADKASLSTTILGKEAILTGDKLAYAPNKTFTFEKLTAGLKGDVCLFNKINIVNATASVEKEQQGGYVFKVGAGINTVDKDTFDLSVENVGMTLANGALEDFTIEKAALNVKGGLIEIASQSIDISLKEKKISAQNLEININSEALGEVPGLSTISSFLGTAKVVVGKLSYSMGEGNDKGLQYSGITITGTASPIKIGKYLTVIPDFEKKKLRIRPTWVFPGGEIITSEGGKKVKPESLIKFDIDFPIVPGVSVSGGIDIGAGIAVDGELTIDKKSEGGFGIDGGIGIYGGAYLGANVGATLGVSNLLSVGAKLYAQLELSLGAEANVKTDVSLKNKIPSFSNTSAALEAKGALEITLGGRLTGKFLFFKEKTLYTKEFGKWELGKYVYEKTFGIDPEEGKVKHEELLSGFEINGNKINDKTSAKNSINVPNQDTEGLTGETVEDSVKAKTIEDIEKDLKVQQEKREALEKLLTDPTVQWGAGGDAVSKIMVEQIKNLSEVYKTELNLKRDKLLGLEKELNERKRSGLATDYIFKIHKNVINSILEQSEKSVNGDTLKIFDKYLGSRQIGSSIRSYHRVIEEGYLCAFSTYLDEADSSLGATTLNAISELKDKNDLDKLYSKLMNRWGRLSNDIKGKGIEGQYEQGLALISKIDSRRRLVENTEEGTYEVGGELSKVLNKQGLTPKGKSQKRIFGENAGKEEIKAIRTSLLMDDAKEMNVLAGNTIDGAGELVKSGEACIMASKEIAEMGALQDKINSFLEEKERYGNDSEKNKIKIICDAIKGRKIKENIKKLTDSEIVLNQILA